MMLPSSTRAVGENQNQNPYIPLKGGYIGEGELLIFIDHQASATPDPLNPTNEFLKKINDDKVGFISTALGVRTEMGVEIVRAAMECVQLFDTKQQDYGSNNISSSGELGIAVRLQDKVSRMRHILLKELKAQEKSAHVFKANHESLEDTYKDAANYVLIGLLLQRKRW